MPAHREAAGWESVLRGLRRGAIRPSEVRVDRIRDDTVSGLRAQGEKKGRVGEGGGGDAACLVLLPRGVIVGRFNLTWFFSLHFIRPTK